MQIIQIGRSFDLQKVASDIASKLHLTSTGIIPEMHIPFANKIANYAGPGTRLDLRLNPDKSPKEWSKPINKIDEFCMYHDIDYESAENNSKTEDEILKLKHIADSKLIERLNDYSPLNINERFIKFLIQKAISLKVKFGMGNQIVTPERAKIIAKELHHQFKMGKRRKVIVDGIDHTHAVDLIEMPKQKHSNGYIYKYVLTCIDIFSKYAWGIMLTNKDKKSLIDALKYIWKERKLDQGSRELRKPKKAWADKESGLYSKECQKFFEDNNVILYSTQSELKSVFIERFNRTLKEWMEKRKTELELQNVKYNWMNEIGNMVEKYNNTVHSTIKMTPVEGSKKENEEKLKKLYEEETSEVVASKFKLGDLVRLWKKKHTFVKRYTTRFTKEVFKIKKIIYSDPIQYEIEDMEEKPISGKIYEWELIGSLED